MAAVRAEARCSNWKILAVVAGCFIFIGLLLAFRFRLLGHDQTMYLYSGDLILHGLRPYVDFFDINPPIVFYLHAAIVYVARVFAFDPSVFFKLLVAAVYFSNVAFASFLLRNVWNLSFAKISVFIVAVSNIMTFGLFTLNWGQRDEFFVFSLLPFLFLRMARQETSSKPLPLAAVLWIAVVCGLAVALKPFFILHLLMVEAFFVFKRRSLVRLLDIEIVIALSIQVFYGLYLSMLALDSTSGFASQVSEVLRYYQTFDFREGDRIDRHLMVLIPWGITSALLLFSPGRLSTITRFLWLQTFTALVCIFLQGRWFLYHLIPLYVLSGVLAVWYSFDLSQSAKRVHRRVVVSALAASFLSTSLYFSYRYLAPNAAMAAETYDTFVARLDGLILKYSDPGDYVLPLSPTPLVAFPSLLRADRRLGSRYLFQYPISFFGTLRTDERSNTLTVALDESASIDEQTYLNNIKNDIESYRPRLIYFMQGQKLRQNLPWGFQFESYFELTGLLKFIEQRYTRHQDGVFTIFIRKADL